MCTWKFKVQAILVLEYEERNDHKIFHPSAKLVSDDPDTEAFKYMHQSIMKKRKNSASKDWIVIETIALKHSIKISEC